MIGTEEPTGEPPAKKNKGLKIALGVGVPVVLLGGGGVGAFFILKKRGILG